MGDSFAGQTALRGRDRKLRAPFTRSRGSQELDAGAERVEGRDHTVPAAISRQTQKLYGDSSAVTDLRTFDDRGHSLTIDSGWREVADSVLGWLGDRSL